MKSLSFRPSPVLAGLLETHHLGEKTMSYTRLTVALTAVLAATPAFAHPGHGTSGHVHWEFVAGALAFAAACGLLVWRRKKAAARK